MNEVGSRFQQLAVAFLKCQVCMSDNLSLTKIEDSETPVDEFLVVAGPGGPQQQPLDQNRLRPFSDKRTKILK